MKFVGVCDAEKQGTALHPINLQVYHVCVHSLMARGCATTMQMLVCPMDQQAYLGVST